MNIRVIIGLLVLALVATACGSGGPAGTATPTPTATQPAPDGPDDGDDGDGQEPEATATPTPAARRTLTILTHESFRLSDNVLQAFESANNATVRFLKLPDAGQALTRAILTSDAPEADVLFGVDNTFFSRAIDADILEAYRSPALDAIPNAFKLDPESRLTPIDFGDVCLNIDKAYFAGKNLPLPQSLADLARPEYQDLLVVENPAGSSPGLAFMLATVSVFGEEGWLDYWQQLKDNGVKVVEDWSTAYYVEFSASSGKGPRPIVVSYASSPPAEVVNST